MAAVRNILIAVYQSLNRQKGSQTPVTWKPPDRAAWCDDAKGWIGVKARCGLSVVAEKQAALVEMQAGCPRPAAPCHIPGRGAALVTLP